MSREETAEPALRDSTCASGVQTVMSRCLLSELPGLGSFLTAAQNDEPTPHTLIVLTLKTPEPDSPAGPLGGKFSLGQEQGKDTGLEMLPLEKVKPAAWDKVRGFWVESGESPGHLSILRWP